jgi:hypothetical protein
VLFVSVAAKGLREGEGLKAQPRKMRLSIAGNASLIAILEG